MSFTFSKPRDFNIGSVCELYLLRVTILTALFCSLGAIYPNEFPRIECKNLDAAKLVNYTSSSACMLEGNCL